MDHDDGDGRNNERDYDTVTFILAAVLAVIVLGAIGYGVFNSSRITTAIPSLTPSQPSSQIERPSTVSTTGAR